MAADYLQFWLNEILHSRAQYLALRYRRVAFVTDTKFQQLGKYFKSIGTLCLALKDSTIVSRHQAYERKPSLIIMVTRYCRYMYHNHLHGCNFDAPMSSENHDKKNRSARLMWFIAQQSESGTSILSQWDPHRCVLRLTNEAISVLGFFACQPTACQRNSSLFLWMRELLRWFTGFVLDNDLRSLCISPAELPGQHRRGVRLPGHICRRDIGARHFALCRPRRLHRYVELRGLVLECPVLTV